MTALRLRVAGQFGLSVDEAHYVLYGKLLDWSYFDHPPLVGWVQALFHLLPLEHHFQARLSAILISVLTSFLLLMFLKNKTGSEKNAMFAVIALNLTPMFNVMSVALLPDTLLMPLTLLIVMSTEKIIEEPPSYPNWLSLGTCLGLAGLTKYTAALYVIALIFIFIFKKRIKEILRLQLWVGVTVALLLISPVLYWNVKNNWISFKYQSDHVFAFDSESLKNFGASLIIQLISWGIGPFLLSFFVFFNSLINVRNNRKSASYFVSLVFLSIFLLFFIYIALSTPLLPHWMLIFFVVLIPISLVQLLDQKKFLKVTLVSFGISAVLSLLLLLELGFKIFPPQLTATLYEGITGWESIITEANEKLEKASNPKKALAVMNWTLGSRAMYYNKSDSPVFVIDARFDQFDIWAKESNLGFDFIAVIEATKLKEHLEHLNCAQLTAAGERKTLIKDVPVNHFLYYHCANFLGYK